MRSEEERDQCIDVLIKKVQSLEEELTKLKSFATAQQSTELPERREEKQDTPQGIFIPNLKQKKDSPKSSNTSLESAIGTRWIGRIGVVAILFGIAFFLKYSFDNKLIGETGRIILGIIWGAVFIGAGEYLQKKKDLSLYGQLLSGGGLAVLYLSLYAAFDLYHLIPASLAAAGMIAVTTTGMALSIRYNAYSLAAIALLGGFLTPVMLSTGQNQPISLFSYIFLLDVGTMLLYRFRQWPSLIAASLLGTALIYMGWHAEFYDDPQRWLALSIIAIFFILYNLHIFISRFTLNYKESTIDQTIVFGAAAFFFFSFLAQNHWRYTWPVKSFILLLAFIEIAIALPIRRSRPAARITIATYATVSFIMTVIATFVVLEQRWIMPALAAEMVALGFIGLRYDLPKLRYGSYLLAFLVLLRFKVDITGYYLEPFHSFVPIFNGRFLVCAAAIIGFYIYLYFFRRFQDKLPAEENNLLKITFVVTQALSLILLSFEVHDFFRFRSPSRYLGWGASHYAYQLSLSVLWALYGAVLIGVGIFKRLRGVRILGILLLCATVLKVFLIDLSSLQTFYRIISFIVLGLLLLAVAYCYNRFKHFIFGENEP